MNLTWEHDRENRMCKAYPPGYRISVGRGYSETTGKVTNRFWNVDTLSSIGHTRLIAQGWCKTLKEAKRLAEAFAAVHAGLKWP